MLSFRADAELKGKIKAAVEQYNLTQEYVLGQLVRSGLELDALLEPHWRDVQALSLKEGVSEAQAIALLVGEAIAARNKPAK